MKKELEDYLWERVAPVGHLTGHMRVRDTIDSMVDSKMISSPKQAWATLEKWVEKGWYDYGVTLDLGWKYPERRPND